MKVVRKEYKLNAALADAAVGNYTTLDFGKQQSQWIVLQRPLRHYIIPRFWPGGPIMAERK